MKGKRLEETRGEMSREERKMREETHWEERREKWEGRDVMRSDEKRWGEAMKWEWREKLEKSSWQNAINIEEIEIKGEEKWDKKTKEQKRWEETSNWKK